MTGPVLLRTAKGSVEMPADHPNVAWWAGTLRCTGCTQLVGSCAQLIRSRRTGEVWHPGCLPLEAVTTGQHQLPGL